MSLMGPRRWPLSTDASCRSRCGTLKNPHWLMTMVKICSLSPAMETSPNEWKIFDWDEKLQTNKQNNKKNRYIPRRKTWCFRDTFIISIIHPQTKAVKTPFLMCVRRRTHSMEMDDKEAFPTNCFGISDLFSM